jgi:hypothetical protein
MVRVSNELPSLISSTRLRLTRWNMTPKNYQNTKLPMRKIYQYCNVESKRKLNASKQR